MAHDDDWEDEEHSRRRRGRARYDDDDDDFDLDRLRLNRATAPSGAITGVGVISIILGCLDLLLGLCMLLGAAFVGEIARQGPGLGMPDIGGGAMAVVVALILLVVLWGILAITSGIGVLNRKQWARILILILSGIGAATGLLIIVGAISAINGGANNNPETIMGIFIYFAVATVLIAYCIWAYVVLLSSRNSSEFR